MIKYFFLYIIILLYLTDAIINTCDKKNNQYFKNYLRGNTVLNDIESFLFNTEKSMQIFFIY